MEFSVENGATESEVENAMKLAQRLMIKYNLEQGDVEIGFNDVNMTIVESTWVGKWVNLEIRSFEWSLLRVLSKVYNCQTLQNRRYITNTDYFKVVGLLEDRTMVVTAFESILPQIRNLMSVRYKESDKSLSQFRFNSSYQTGFLDGLREKLSEDKEMFFTEEEKSSWGLIIVKKDTLIEDWVQEELKPKLVKQKGVDLDAETYFLGKEDGSEKGLNKQLGERFS